MFDENNPWNLGKKPVGNKTPNNEDILSKAVSDVRFFLNGLTRNRAKNLISSFSLFLLFLLALAFILSILVRKV
nr:hypothetical protein [Rickettsia endosymbiont of Ceutorhynchus assimilis]